MRPVAFAVLAVLGVLACGTLHPIVLTGRVTWPDSTGADVRVRLRGPGVPEHRRGAPPDASTDASGRFLMRRELARGCYAANMLSLETNHIVEWHFWVQGADSLTMGQVTIWPSAGQSGEGVNHLVLDCGTQDTLRSMYSWHYDTVRVVQPAD